MQRPVADAHEAEVEDLPYRAVAIYQALHAPARVELADAAVGRARPRGATRRRAAAAVGETDAARRAVAATKAAHARAGRAVTERPVRAAARLTRTADRAGRGA